MPVIVSPTLLELYNGQFASSHGLPVIGQFEQFVATRGGLGKMRFYIGLGDTMVAGSNIVVPAHQQRQVRIQLASVLKAAVSQRLMPRANHQGRTAAVEIMITTPYIRDCIIDKEKTHSIPGAIATGTSQYGMQTFDQSIFSHFTKGIISYDDALRYATNKDEFKLKVQGIATTAEMARDEMLRASTGDPASSPWNSPICHWRHNIHRASRTSALSARSKSWARGRPSSRFQRVMAGRSLASSA